MKSTAALSEQRSKAIHRHSFWLYSVIVGLSLEEVLRHILPHVEEVAHKPELYMYREFWRLAIFLTLIVRFYLGAVSFFNKNHAGLTNLNNKSYITDFLFGLIHFSAFFGLALAIDGLPIPDRHVWIVPNMFMFWLIFILLYDVIWLAMCWQTNHKATFNHVLPWASLNILNLVISTVFYISLKWILEGQGRPRMWVEFWSECAFLLPILAFSIVDTLEVLDENPRFSRWIGRGLAHVSAVFQHPEDNTLGPVSPDVTDVETYEDTDE